MDCGQKFIDVEQRIEHLVQVHEYPTNFEFDVIYGEPDRKKSTKKKPRKKKPNPKVPEKSNVDDMDIDELVEQFGGLMPNVVKFGHRKQRVDLKTLTEMHKLSMSK